MIRSKNFRISLHGLLFFIQMCYNITHTTRVLQDVLVLAAAGGALPRNPAHRDCCQQTRRRCQGLMQRTQVLACAPAGRFRPRAGRPSGGWRIGQQLVGRP